MMDHAKLAQLLFPHVTQTPQQLLEEVFPPRQLKDGALVTRFAPSPTGFLHIGGVFTAMVGERAAHTSGGRVILRIEDTDKKREVKGGVSQIVQGLTDFGITFDEGATGDDTEQGDYAPYTQSKRAQYYHVFCKDLVEKGLAYPCFCSAEEIAELRAGQEEKGVTPGYWGEYAKCRDLTLEQIEENLKAGKPYVMRMRSPGKPGDRVKYKDGIRGDIEMEANFVDVVLLKSDGIPTYHFAHIVDDTLMRVNQVIRADEWIASVPIHLQMFWLCGLKAPKYAHVSPIMKEEDGSKRKLSKRKDPEAAVDFFVEEGYPAEAVVEYLLTIANSNFEDWRKQNKTAHYNEFPFKLNKMSASGALFDMMKLNSVSADVISRMDNLQVYAQVLAWAQRYDAALYGLLAANPDYGKALFAIDRGGKKPRKDIIKWKDVAGYAAYFYDELFTRDEELEMDKDLQLQVLEAYTAVMDCQDDKDTWFGKMKDICEPLGMSPDVKAYKAAPDQFKGHVGDVSAVVRMAICGRRNTPDLHAIMALLGQEKCLRRLDEYKAILEGKKPFADAIPGHTGFVIQ